MRIPIAVIIGAVLLFARPPVMATTCTTVAACLLGQNSSTGLSSDIGVEGISEHGFGLVGITLATPANTAAAKAGLYGKDQSSGSYNSGVSAFSENGTGVTAFSAHGNGVVGTTALNVYNTGMSGVLGIDASALGYNAGVSGQSVAGAGVSGGSTNSIGVNAYSMNGPAINAESLYGAGVEVFAGLNGIGINVEGGQYAPIVQIGSIGPEDFIDGYLANTQQNELEFSFDREGNEVLAGQLTTSGGTYARTRGTGGTDVAAYGARTASPTLEDFGQGTLRAGSGHVALDPTFASTIDTRSYLIFITPHGDSHSLYTIALGANGFDVRESEHGSSSLSFDYRIVGRPLDMATAAHLPAIRTLPQFSAAANARHRFKQMIRPKPFHFHKATSSTS